MISIKNLHKTYNKGKKNEFQALRGIDLEIGSTGLVCILGESGSGKTTLLNTIGGLDTYNEGQIIVDEPEDYGYIFQNYYVLNDHSVAYNVKLALNRYDISDEEKDARVEYVLDMLGMGRYKKKPISKLSGGQKQRVSIARALVKSPTIIFADEPTGNLDEENTIRTMSILKSISKECLVLLVTHERRIANFFADRIIEVADGRIVKDVIHENSESYTRSDDSNIYLKELENAKLESDLANFNIYYRGEVPENIQLNIAFVDGKLYIQNRTACDIVFTGEESGVEMIDDVAPTFDMEDVEKVSYHLEKMKDKGSAHLSWKEIRSIAMENLRTLRHKQAFIIAIFLVSAILLTITLAQFVSTKSVNEEDVVTTDSHYLSLTFDKVSTVRGSKNQQKILEYAKKYLQEEEAFEAFLVPNQDIYLSASGLVQMENITQLVRNYSFVDVKRISDSDLIAGRMPATRNEVVVDRRVLQGLMKSGGVVSSMYEKMEDYLGIEFMLYAHETRMTIVGISDTKEPNIYACQNLLLGLDARSYNVASCEEYLAMGGEQVTLADDEVLLREGQYEALYSEKEDQTMKFGDDTKSYRIVGTIPDDCGLDYVLNQKQCKHLRDVMIYNNKKVLIYTNDLDGMAEYLKNAAKEYESAFNLIITVPHDEQLKEYFASSTMDLNAMNLISIIIVVISLVMIYFTMKSNVVARMEELIVYRLLGISKGSILKAYLLEMAVLTTMTSLPAVLVTTGVMKFIGRIPSLKVALYFPWPAALGLILGLYALHLVISILPVYGLLSKPPATLAVKN